MKKTPKMKEEKKSNRNGPMTIFSIHKKKKKDQSPNRQSSNNINKNKRRREYSKTSNELITRIIIKFYWGV